MIYLIGLWLLAILALTVANHAYALSRKLER